MIEVENLSMKYPSGKGVFDLNFKVNHGQVMGYLGPNGAGKTTTIRQLMGFMQPDKGYCRINELDCFKKAPEIHKFLGYLPGEISFLEGMSGDEYLKYTGEVRGIKDLAKQNRLIDMFEFSPKGSIKKFSKGMKQKLGIVTAFMHDPQVLILDEPTSGLDPLMQSRFIELILEEKKNGKTILMSSHIFEEVERTCDNVLIIKDGRIVANSDIDTLKAARRKAFIIKTDNNSHAEEVLRAAGFKTGVLPDSVEVFVSGGKMDIFTKTISGFTVKDLEAKVQSLEDVFMNFYTREDLQ